MQRGILQLQKDEVEAIEPYLPDIREEFQDLVERWQTEKEGKVAIEISAEQAEALLDTLPPPSQEYPPALFQARTVLAQFIASLRGEKD